MVDDSDEAEPYQRNRVGGDDDDAIAKFARHNGVTPDQVRELIEKHGNDRSILTEHARRLPGTKSGEEAEEQGAGG